MKSVSENFHACRSLILENADLTETTAIYYSWSLFFTENTATFLKDLKRARVTVFFFPSEVGGRFPAESVQKDFAPNAGSAVKHTVDQRAGLQLHFEGYGVQ